MTIQDERPGTPPGEETSPASGEQPLSSGPEAAAPSAEPVLSVPLPPPDPWAHLPEDLRAPWGWRDLVVFLFFAIGSMIVLGQFVAAALLVYFQVGPAMLDKIPGARAIVLTTQQAVWSGIILLYLAVMMRLRFDAPFWRTLGWRDLRLAGASRVQTYLVMVLGGSVLSIFVQLASVVSRPSRKLPIEQLFQHRESVLLLMAMAVLVAPLVEETIFRGFLYPVLARSFGIGAGVIITGALFGFMHAPQLWGGWGQIGLLIIVGIVFTYVRARTGTVLAPYLLHLGYNTIIFVGVWVGTEGLRRLPGN